MRPFVAVNAITFFSHHGRDECLSKRVVKLLCLNRHVFWIKNDWSWALQSRGIFFSSKLPWAFEIDTKSPLAHKRDGSHPKKKAFQPQVSTFFPSRIVVGAKHERESLESSHEPWAKRENVPRLTIYRRENHSNQHPWMICFVRDEGFVFFCQIVSSSETKMDWFSCLAMRSMRWSIPYWYWVCEVMSLHSRFFWEKWLSVERWFGESSQVVISKCFRKPFIIIASSRWTECFMIGF